MRALPASVIAFFLLAQASRSPGQASSRSFESVAPKALPGSERQARLPAIDSPDVADDTPVLRKLRGIVLLSDSSQVRAKGVQATDGVKSIGVGLMSSPELANQLSSFLQKPATFGDLQRIGTEIVRFYRAHNRPVVDAQLPEQDVTNGVVQVVVVEGKAGKVIAEGQQWFSEERLVSAVRLEKGGIIDSARLLDDINWLNRNPFRRTDILFRKGEEATETDVVLKTTDRRPFRPYVGFDNWGTDLEGNERYQIGFNWGNAFNLDQTLSYQFTIGPDYELFNAHAGVWTIPLPWRHILEFYGSYAQSKPDSLDVDVIAKTLQLGAQYTIPLPSYKSVRQEVGLGVEYKTSNNNLLFGGTSVFASDTAVAQVRLTYQARENDARGSTTLQASGYYSPGGLMSGNDDEAFQQERAYAEAEYVYARLTVQRTQNLPMRFSLVGTLIGQISSTNLLASEQLSLGGATTIRGYEEGVLNGDRGWLGSIELYTPPLRVLNRVGLTNIEDELKLVAFGDFGGVSNVHLLPGESNYYGISSIGAGIRYRINTWMSVRFDYAWALQSIRGIDTDSSRAYVSVSVSY